MQTIKCVVVGDGGVGKTCLLVSYATNKFPTEYVPTVFDHYSVTVMIQEIPYTLALFDMGGQEEFKQLRTYSYTNMDVLLICFSVTSRSSFDNLKEVWMKERATKCPGTPFLLVGTKTDLRSDPGILQNAQRKNNKPISTEEGRKKAAELKAYKYVECSSKTQEGLKNVFDEAILAALRSVRTPSSRKCVIL